MLLCHLHVGGISCSGDFFLLFYLESVTLQGNAALFIDGFFLVAAFGKLEKAKIFGGFADRFCGLQRGTVLRKGSESMCYATVIGGTSSRQQKDLKTSTLQEHGAACAQRYRRKSCSAADKVASISGTRRQQSGLSRVSLRPYSTSTC